MSEIDTTAIDSIYSGNCLSISGRSHLIYTVGKSRANSALYLRIADSTGNGVWCKDWAPAAAIEAIVAGAHDLTAKSFHCLHPGKSINTGGFVLAALKDLGLLRPKEANTRLHEHVPMATLELAMQNAPRAKDRDGETRQVARGLRKGKGGA